LKDTKRAEYVAVNDKEALTGFRLLCELEGICLFFFEREKLIEFFFKKNNKGIIPALESSHAIYHAIELAKTLPKDQDIVICLSGRGDKDIQSVAEALPKYDCPLKIE